MSSASWARERELIPVPSLSRCPACKCAWGEGRRVCSACGYDALSDTLVEVTPATGVVLVSKDVLPGEICPTCGEKTPSEAALKMREWRAKRG